MPNRKPRLGLKKTAPSQLSDSLQEQLHHPGKEWDTQELLSQEEKVLQKRNLRLSKQQESLVQETLVS